GAEERAGGRGGGRRVHGGLGAADREEVLVQRVVDGDLLHVEEHPDLRGEVVPGRVAHGRRPGRGERPVAALVVGGGQAELLEVVDALAPPGRLARRLHGGQ